MAASAARVVVEGQKELERALLKMRREVVAGIKPELVKIGAKAAEEARSRAPEEITNITERWSEFRVGITTQAHYGALGFLGLGPLRTPMVYIAPKARRRTGPPRKNLAPMLAEVMQGAADSLENQLWAEVGALIDTVATHNRL